jgi:hypothetical protein
MTKRNRKPVRFRKDRPQDYPGPEIPLLRIGLTPEEAALPTLDKFKILYNRMIERCPAIHLEIPLQAAVPLVATLRFSLRHPGIGPLVVSAGLSCIEAIENVIQSVSPDMADLMHQMDDWSQDVPVRPDFVLPRGCPDEVLRHLVMDRLGHTTDKVCETPRQRAARYGCSCGQTYWVDNDFSERSMEHGRDERQVQDRVGGDSSEV